MANKQCPQKVNNYKCCYTFGDIWSSQNDKYQEHTHAHSLWVLWVCFFGTELSLGRLYTISLKRKSTSKTLWRKYKVNVSHMFSPFFPFYLNAKTFIQHVQPQKPVFKTSCMMLKLWHSSDYWCIHWMYNCNIIINVYIFIWLILSSKDFFFGIL